MTRNLSGALVLLALSALPVQAQDSTRIARGEVDVLVLDLMVDPAANARQTVFLQKGITYRVQFGGPGITIQMRSRANLQLPLLISTTSMADASGATEYLMYPQADGDIDFTPIANDARVPVRFRIWRDVRATERAQQAAEEGGWEIGFEGTFGRHGAYSYDGSEFMGSGTRYGACFSFRNGPGVIGVLNGCAFGVETQAVGNDENIIQYFTEPRVRILGTRRSHIGWGTEAGLAFHLGIADGASASSSAIYGAGLYVARDLRQDAEGTGWRALLQVRRDRLQDGAEVGPSPADLVSTTAQVSIGYYW